ncbi:MAG: maleylpyruvate isomerase family mycothiol-dependent enzyme [Nocardioides sp.]|nr:maleylpyruvate isomerase family mycothiol-dependent enzyme [Nocardioides sp.]
MSDTADRIIASLRAHHDLLAGLAGGLDSDGLSAASGASRWSIADVFSHLGSGAEIMLGTVTAVATGAPVPEQDNHVIWDRWNASTPREQAAGFVQRDARLVEALEALTDDQRDHAQVQLGFVPQPIPLEAAIGMRLNEVAQHTWDVQVALDPDATLDEGAAELLVDLYAASMGFMLGFTGRAEAVDDPAVVEAFGHGLVVDESVLLVAEPPVAPTATFVGSKEAFVRLIGGRLSPDRTPRDVHVSGNVSLEDLRRVFPGF